MHDAFKGNAMLTGSCLCGAVRYELAQSIDEITFCHCINCQKATGSAFNSTAVVSVANFKLKAGSTQLKAYSSSPDVLRHFCGECGSPLYSSRRSEPTIYRLRLGSLEQLLQPAHKQHVFVAEQALWHDIAAGETQYNARA